MLIKNGEYNSLWQLVGDLKVNEPKTISLPGTQQKSTKTKTQDNLPLEIASDNHGDDDDDESIMAEIENHQKRHIFAPTLYQAEQNYRELRRLLRKMNRNS